MLMITTPSVDGWAIADYLGIVTGEAILGASVFKDVAAFARDIVGGRSAAYEREVKSARDDALAAMEAEAADRGGHAIVGIDIDYETVSNSIMMVSASGTVVRLAPIWSPPTPASQPSVNAEDKRAPQ